VERLRKSVVRDAVLLGQMEVQSVTVRRRGRARNALAERSVRRQQLSRAYNNNKSIMPILGVLYARSTQAAYFVVTGKTIAIHVYYGKPVSVCLCI